VKYSRKDSERHGLAQRNHMGRSELAKLARRSFDPIEVLGRCCKGRIPELLPIKFKLMSGSPFVFYRGSVEIMAADLAAGKRTGIEVQLCGDAHVKNFGFYASPNAEVILDVNDFDETIRGPWEWDVKRMATSIVLAGQEAGEKNSRCHDAAGVFVAQYCSWMRRFADMPTMEVARHRITRDYRDPFMRTALMKAERSGPLGNLQKLTKKTKNGRRFRCQPNVLWEIEGQTRKAVLGALGQYRETLSPDHQVLFDRYQPVDVGFKVVGTGSVGTRDYIVLLLGHDENDPLFLQIKEESYSSYSSYLNDRSVPNHQGERVVRGQRLMQVLSDLLLGWCSIDGRDYLVRQLNDHKSAIDPEELSGKRLNVYSRICAELLAKGHARAGDPVALAAYLGNSDKAVQGLQRFAIDYADQVQDDYNSFRKALKSGDLTPDTTEAAASGR
jgi:uncharacterized protein (DUF2252 family)